MSIRRFTAAAACALVLGFQANAQDAGADTVLATVNGTDITLGHVIALVDKLPDNYRSIPDKDLYEGVLDQMIQQTAIAAGVDRDSLAIQLAVENEARAVMASDALDAVGAAASTDELVAEIYESEYAEGETEYRASHILVETEEEAKELVTLLKDGADFAQTAKDKSTGPSGPAGGDLGWFTKDRMVAPFADAVAMMEVGGISDPVQTQFGWHVINLVETRMLPPKTLQEVEGEIRNALSQAAIQAAIAAASESAEISRSDVDIDPALIRRVDLLAE